MCHRFEPTMDRSVGYGAVHTDATGTDDQPQSAIRCRRRGIPGRRGGQATGVRVVPADDRRPTGPGGAMGGEQRNRVDLEAVGRPIRDVAACRGSGDVVGCAEQQAADLAPRVARSMVADLAEE